MFITDLNLILESSVSDDEDDLFYGPQLPTHLKQNKCAEMSSFNEKEGCKQTNDRNNEEEISSDGDNEVIGPLPNMESSQTFLQLEKRAALLKNKSKNRDRESCKEAKREEWMTVLPELEKKNFGLGMVKVHE